MSRHSAENDAPMTTTGHAWVCGQCVRCGHDVPHPWAETCRAPGVAAALSLALRQGAREHLGLDEGDYWPSDLAAAQATFLLDAGWRIIPPAPCCAPDGDEEHCNHHPEWSDAHGCNHPDCKAARPIPPGEPR